LMAALAREVGGGLAESGAVLNWEAGRLLEGGPRERLSCVGGRAAGRGRVPLVGPGC
jgi:hypothetical protein